MANEQFSIKERHNTDIRRPRRFKVVFHNDDFTPMEFVVMVLSVVFHKTLEEAETVMLNVHHKGKDTAGVFSYDIATTKAEKAVAMARNEGFPLRITVEEA